jgi:hypothetical protein
MWSELQGRTMGIVQLKCDGPRWRREGKWMGNLRMEWVASTLHTNSEHGVSMSLTENITMCYECTKKGKKMERSCAGLSIFSPLMVYPALLPLMRTHQLPAVDWTDALADLNGLVRFVERRNLVSANVSSHLKRSPHKCLCVSDGLLSWGMWTAPTSYPSRSTTK